LREPRRRSVDDLNGTKHDIFGNLIDMIDGVQTAEFARNCEFEPDLPADA